MAFTLPWKKEEEQPKIDPVVMCLKRGVLATQKGEFDEAEKYFHEGLHLGSEQHRQKEIDDR